MCCSLCEVEQVSKVVRVCMRMLDVVGVVLAVSSIQVIGSYLAMAENTLPQRRCLRVCVCDSANDRQKKNSSDD